MTTTDTKQPVSSQLTVEDAVRSDAKKSARLDRWKRFGHVFTIRVHKLKAGTKYQARDGMDRTKVDEIGVRADSENLLNEMDLDPCDVIGLIDAFVTRYYGQQTIESRYMNGYFVYDASLEPGIREAVKQMEALRVPSASTQ